MSAETPQQTNSCSTPTEVKELQIVDTDLVVVSQPKKKYPSITARDWATILGENKYETAWTLLEKKVENKHRFFGNTATQHGQKFEKEAIETYEFFTNTKVNSEFKNLKHKDYDFLTGRPDGLSDSQAIVEIKCPQKKRQNLKLEDIAPQYWAQCQVYMEMMNREIAHYVEYYCNEDTGEHNLQYVAIVRDRQWFKQSIPIIQKFHDEIKHYCDLGNSLDTHPIRVMEKQWNNNLKN